jgi:hypothetical protein
MEALNTGTATRNPDWVGDSDSSFEMYGASGPNMTQAVKPVSKYRKHASNAFQFPLLSDSIISFTQLPPDPVSKKKRQLVRTLPIDKKEAYGLAALPV